MKISKFALAAIAMVAFSLSSWGSDKMRTTIHIDQAVSVGSAQLAPGAYTVTWAGNSSDAEVTFAQGKRVIATVPAHVIEVRSGYAETVIETDTRTNTLTKIAVPKRSLSFTNNAEISSN